MGYFAKEGYPWMFIGIFFTIASYVNNINPNHPKLLYFLIWTVPMICVTLFLIFFFRDPKRDPPPEFVKGVSILCPADGTLRDIEQENGNLAFYIEMHGNNVHVCRTHKAGKIINVTRTAGKNYPIYYLKKKKGKTSEAVRKNARVTIDFVDLEGKPFQYQLICGRLARRAKPYVTKGQFLNEGEKTGIIIFGSLVKITVPGLNYRLNLKVGDNVRATKMILCEKIDENKIKSLNSDQYNEDLNRILMLNDLDLPKSTKISKSNKI